MLNLLDRRRPDRIAVLVFLAFAALAGCGEFSQKPRPKAAAVAPAPWRIRCDWVTDAAKSTQKTGSVWATDEAGSELLADGGLEDGFLRVDAIRPQLRASAIAVKERCAASIARLSDAPGAEVYDISAAHEEDDAPVVMAFPVQIGTAAWITRLVIFGDSLSDTGNLKRRLKVLPESPYWLGRFSNGPNWVDWLTQSSSLAVQNHSYGGALAEPHADVPAADVVAAIEVSGQHFVSGSIDQYVDDYIAHDLDGGRVARPNETAFLFWGGANDYLSKEPFSGDISTLLDTPKGEAGYERVVEQTVKAIENQVRRLYAAGARRFVIVNLPDMGRLPLVLHNTSYQPAGVMTEEERRVRLAEKLTDVTDAHNLRLADTAGALSRELKGASIARIDARRFLHDMLNSGGPRYSPFGFAFGPQTRVLSGPPMIRIEDRCYAGGYLGSKNPAEICPTAARAMFWDLVHPTSYFHCWISWLFRTDFARAGWLGAGPSQAEQLRRCQTAVVH